MEPQQIFNFVGCQCNLPQGIVRPITERWKALVSKKIFLLSRTCCSQLMSLINLFTATEKQVLLGHLLHATNLIASQEHSACARFSGKGYFVPRSLKWLSPHLRCWQQKKQHTSRSALHSLRQILQMLQRHQIMVAVLSEEISPQKVIGHSQKANCT